MSAYMGRELLLFARSIWYGVFLMMTYDCLRIWRRVCAHPVWLVAAEDLVFWIGSGFFLFACYFWENEGILRAYLFAGVAVGIGAWYYSLSPYFVRYVSVLLIKVRNLLKIPAGKVLILAKRLKFWVARCKISIEKPMKNILDRWQQDVWTDRGAENGKGQSRRKKKKNKRKTGKYAE